MSKSLRIIFYGTPEFATGILKVLHESHHQIVGVVTAPDKPAGRGRKLHESDVKKYALKQNLPLLQPTNLKSADFIKQLEKINADLQVVVAFRMLPRVVWSMPALGTFNLHASMLPQYRGAAPINWAIINGEKKTGVTTFFIDEKIDTGAIIHQREIDIEPDETVGTLYAKLMVLGADLSLDIVNQIAQGSVSTTVQKDAQNIKEAPKLDATNTTIDFNKTATQVHALVRGLNPSPVAKASLMEENTQVIKVFKTEILSKRHHMQPGSIVIDEGQLMVACKEGFIIIHELQLPNKKRMETTDLLNGYQFSADARFDVA